MAKHSWSTVEALWPAVVDANRSEKPSVVKLLDANLAAVGKFVDTIDIEQKVGDRVVARARALWSTGYVDLAVVATLYRVSHPIIHKGFSDKF